MTDVNDLDLRVLDKTHLDKILDFEKLCFGTDCWKKEDWIDLLQEDRASYYALMNKDDIVANLFVYNWQGEKDFLKIMNIAVHPAYRKQGFARILLDKAYNLMVNSNLHRICGETRKSNIPMQKAFESSGYKLNKIETQCYSNPDEDGCKYVFMEINKITDSI